MHTDFARLAPNHTTLSQHLLTIIINVVLCSMHLRVHSGIDSYAQLALINKIGMLLPFRSLVENLFRGPLLVGNDYQNVILEHPLPLSSPLVRDNCARTLFLHLQTSGWKETFMFCFQVRKNGKKNKQL